MKQILHIYASIVKRIFRIHASRTHVSLLRWNAMLDIKSGVSVAALTIELVADAVDIGKTIHPHPTLGESIGMAAEVAHGSCTDLPPARK